jgi:DNA-binding GntR family transcriptional regulator
MSKMPVQLDENPGLEGLTVGRGVLGDSIAQALKAAIFRGQLRPGQKLNEKQLAAQLNVSRAPLREAFWKLQEDGLITRIPHKGAIVTVLSLQDVLEISAIRVHLESLAARLATEQFARAPNNNLRQKYERLVELSNQGDLLERNVADYEFHHTIWVLSGNQKLVDLLSRLCTPFFTFAMIEAKAMPLDKVFSASIVAGEHLPIVEAIEGGSPDEAERVVREIISRFREEFIRRNRNDNASPL